MTININERSPARRIENSSYGQKRKILCDLFSDSTPASPPQQAHLSPVRVSHAEEVATPPRKKAQVYAESILSPKAFDFEEPIFLKKPRKSIRQMGNNLSMIRHKPVYQREPDNYQWNIVVWKGVTYDLTSYAKGDKSYVFDIKEDQAPILPEENNADIIAKRYRNPRVFLESFYQEKQLRECLVKNGFKVTEVLDFDVKQNVIFERKIPYSCGSLSDQWAKTEYGVDELPLFTQKALKEIGRLFVFAALENKAVDFALRNMLYYSEDSDIYLCDLNGEREHLPDEVRIFLLATLKELACDNKKIFQFFIEPLKEQSPELYDYFSQFIV